MLDYLMQYALFLAEAVTVVAAVAAVIVVSVAASRRDRGADRLEVRDLGERYDTMLRTMQRETMPRKAFKAEEKLRRKAEKTKEKAAVATDERRVFVIDFKGDIRASAVASLREEITAVLTLATGRDEVLVRLENAGGMVHEHGLAASQLLRVKARGIPLTIAVDKVAASGGYMMACVADRVLAAPFAILGSIGVLAQIPNFHRLLDGHGIDFEQFKGGRYKRTVTMFGENTDADREKLREEIDEVHVLFKEFVAEHRPGLDVERVATGEHWLGKRALALGLCDALTTSDDYLLERKREAELLAVRYQRRRKLAGKLAAAVESTAAAIAERAAEALWRRRFDGRFAG